MGTLLSSVRSLSGEGNELLGQKAPAWDVSRWINGNPGSLESLKGKVVLVRWWVDECAFCKASSTSLNKLHKTYHDQGLRVIGMYHLKPAPGPVSTSMVEAAAGALGFSFSIGVDDEWTNLKRWWFPNGEKRDYTSVSFILDKEGIIRYVHPGPEFHEDQIKGHESCNRDYKKIEGMIKQLLFEN